MQQLKSIQRNFLIKLKSLKEIIVSEIKHIIDRGHRLVASIVLLRGGVYNKWV